MNCFNVKFIQYDNYFDIFKINLFIYLFGNINNINDFFNY